mgnify:CR=1 FL=1|jgi:hypothetical protein
MYFRFVAVSVRKKKGININEGSFESEAEALGKLIDLGEDRDCLLAEIQRWPFADADDELDDPSTEEVEIVAQSRRVDGEWQAVEDDLLCRTRGLEARQIQRGQAV